MPGFIYSGPGSHCLFICFGPSPIRKFWLCGMTEDFEWKQEAYPFGKATTISRKVLVELIRILICRCSCSNCLRKLLYPTESAAIFGLSHPRRPAVVAIYIIALLSCHRLISTSNTQASKTDLMNDKIKAGTIQ